MIKVHYIFTVMISYCLCFTSVHASEYSKQNIQALIVKQADEYGVEPALALAMAQVASNFNQFKEKGNGAIGIMQINAEIAERHFSISEKELFNVQNNIKVALRYIKGLLVQYRYQNDIALSHYYSGKVIENDDGIYQVFPKALTYVNNVLLARTQFIPLAQQILRQQNITLREKAITVSKPEDSTTVLQSGFDKTRYGKIEQLKAIRLHNIMRNTHQYNEYQLRKNQTLLSRKNAKINTEEVTTKKIEVATQLPISEKQQKVLRWEAIFN